MEFRAALITPGGIRQDDNKEASKGVDIREVSLGMEMNEAT